MGKVHHIKINVPVSISASPIEEDIRKQKEKLKHEPKNKQKQKRKSSTDISKLIDKLNHSIKALEKVDLASESEFVRAVQQAGIEGTLKVGYTKDGGLRIRKSNTVGESAKLQQLSAMPDRTVSGLRNIVSKANAKLGKLGIDKPTMQYGKRDMEKIRRRYEILELAGYSEDSNTTFDLAEALKDVSLAKVKANVGAWAAGTKRFKRDLSTGEAYGILAADTFKEAAEKAKIANDYKEALDMKRRFTKYYDAKKAETKMNKLLRQYNNEV